MTIQYNIAVKVLDESKEGMVETSLRPYAVFSDRSGNLKDTCFSRETLPYIGEMIVVKTLSEQAAQTAYRVLSKLEGLLVLPINEGTWEEDCNRAEINKFLRNK